MHRIMTVMYDAAEASNQDDSMESANKTGVKLHAGVLAAIRVVLLCTSLTVLQQG